MRKPFYKASHKAWLILDTRKGSPTEGKQVTLAKGPKAATEPEAMAAWAAMQGAVQADAPQATALTLAELVKEWLAWVGRHRSKETLRAYRKYANQWATKHGATLVASIRGFHVTKLCDEEFPATEGYSDTVRWQAQKVAVCMFRWAKREGLIDVNPLADYRKSSKCGTRNAFLKEEQFDKLLAGCDDADFRDLLICLWETGARPFELFQATAAHLEREKHCLRFVRATGDKVKKAESRIIWLSTRAFGIVSRLADQYPAGPLFRNNIGRAYTISGCSRRFATLFRKTGIKTTLYEFRHGFAHHHATVKRTDIVTLAALMGHANTKMLAEVYAHVDANTEFMLKAVG